MERGGGEGWGGSCPQRSSTHCMCVRLCLNVSGQLVQLQANQAAGWCGIVNEDAKLGVKHQVAARVPLRANMSDCESRSPVSTALTWLKSHVHAFCRSHIHSGSSSGNGRKHSWRDNNGGGRGAPLQEQLFITREIKISQCGLPCQKPLATPPPPSPFPTPFFRWYLFRVSGLVSVYISCAAMAQDMNAAGACG